MFGKKKDKDPKEALDKADKMLNKGISGGLIKGLMGKGFADQMSSAIGVGQDAIAAKFNRLAPLGELTVFQ